MWILVRLTSSENPGPDTFSLGPSLVSVLKVSLSVCLSNKTDPFQISLKIKCLNEQKNITDSFSKKLKLKNYPQNPVYLPTYFK